MPCDWTIVAGVRTLVVQAAPPAAWVATVAPATLTIPTCVPSSGDVVPPAALAVLAAPGGQQLYDPATEAEYSKDGAGYYVDGVGNRLTVKAGVAAGAEVRPYLAGIPAGVLVGTPSTVRAPAGFDRCTAAHHGIVALAASDVAFAALVRVSLGAVPDSDTRVLLWHMSPINSGVALSLLGTAAGRLQLQQNGQNRISQTINLPAALGSHLWIGASGQQTSPGTMAVELHTWDDTGALHDSRAASSAGFTLPLTGPYSIGARTVGAQVDGTVNGSTIDAAVGWDGSAPTRAEMESVIAAYEPERSIDGIAASMATNGLDIDVTDESAPTALPYIGAQGDGTPIMVAQP